MKYLTVLLLVAAVGPAFGQTDDSLWISHYNGVDGWFAFQGPQRAMKLDPADFGLEHPVRVESLKSWFYWGMGSRDDTVITFRIYGADGTSLLFESESISVPASNWVYYEIPEMVVIDSGPFYIATAHRLVNPFAHPYVNVDNNTSPSHSYYGTPGSWTLDNVGEFCFFAFVREVATGCGEGRWTGSPGALAAPTLGVRELYLAGPGSLVSSTGRLVARLKPGSNYLGGVRAGIYFVRTSAGTAPRRLVITR